MGTAQGQASPEASRNRRIQDVEKPEDMTYRDMLHKLRSLGITAFVLARWGRTRGRNFSGHSINSYINRDCTNPPRADIAATIKEMYERLCL